MSRYPMESTKPVKILLYMSSTSSLGDRVELHALCELLHASSLEPLVEVLALADVKSFELMAAVHNGLDTDTRDTDTAADREIVEVEKVETDATKRGIGDGAAAE